MGYPTAPFPLSWPDGWKRTKTVNRQSSRFRLPIARSVEILQHEMRLMPSAVKVIISTNLPTSNKGVPYAAGRLGRGDDPGAAVWWVHAPIGKQSVERVIACDRYRSVDENLAAIAHSIEAIRKLERWGASEVVERAFAGFAALPAGSGETVNVAPAYRDWRDVFDISAHLEQLCHKKDLLSIIRGKHRDLALKAHPDHGGTPEQMAELNAAFEAAEKELAE